MVKKVQRSYAESRELMEQGAFEEAMAKLDEVLQISMDLNDFRAVGTALNDFGVLYERLGNPEGALEYYDRALTVRQRTGDLHGEALTRSNIGNAHIALGHAAEALDQYRHAVSMFREVGDHEREAAATSVLEALQGATRPSAPERRATTPETPRAGPEGPRTRDEARQRFARSQALLQQGAVDEALAELWQVRDIAQELDDRDLEGMTLAAVGGLQRDAGRLREATETLAEAVEFNHRLGNRDREAHSLGMLADTCRDLGDREAAAGYLQRALALRPAESDPRETAETLQKLGVVCSEIGRVDDALAHGQEALRLYRQLGDRSAEGRLLHNLGVTCSAAGRFQEALQNFEEGLRLARDEGSQFAAATALEGLGALLSRSGRPQEALQHFEEALAIRREMGDRVLEGRALTNVAVILEEFGRQSEALRALEEALDIASRAGDLEGERTVSNNLGALYRDMGRPQQALPYLERGAHLSQQLGRADTFGQMLNNLGAINLDLGESAKATALFEEAVRISRELGDRPVESQALGNLARVHRSRGSTKEALERFEQAVSVIETLRGEVAGEELRTSFFATMQEIYDEYSSLLVEEGKAMDGFHVAERGKGRAFLDLLAEAQADVRQGVDPELRAEEQRLLAELSDLREQLVAARSLPEGEIAEAIATLERQNQDRTHELHAVEARIRSANPRYAALTQLTAWELPEIQERLLDEHSALLEYVLADRGSLLFCVLKDDFEVFSLPPREQIEQQVRELRAAVLFGLHRYPHGRELYEALIGPAEALVAGKELLICADGALHYLPFALLLSKDPADLGPAAGGGEDERPTATRAALGAASGEERELLEQLETELGPLPGFDWATLPYLVCDHALSYAPSATVAGLVRGEAARRAQSPPAYAGALAAFACPLEHNPAAGAESAALTAARAHTRAGADPLPFAREEALTLASLFEGEGVCLRTDSEATKREVLELTSGEQAQLFRLFHLACHGLLDNERPQFSGLVLSPEDGADNYWQAFEVLNAHIPSELVVLSACETGLGRLVRGEGVVALTRSFLYAGAASVCVSLWEVADVSGPPFMHALYRRLKTGDPRARALQQAQLEQLTGRYRHPLYWAPYVLVGEGRLPSAGAV